MCKEDFNENHIRELIHKLSIENSKNIFIAGDFNIDLVKVLSHAPTADFYDLLQGINYGGNAGDR